MTLDAPKIKPTNMLISVGRWHLNVLLSIVNHRCDLGVCFQNPLAQIEDERREHHTKLIKMEKEMEEVFERKVREKKQKLTDSEADLVKRHRESKEKLEQQKRDLESRVAAFQQEKVTFAIPFLPKI